MDNKSEKQIERSFAQLFDSQLNYLEWIKNISRAAAAPQLGDALGNCERLWCPVDDREVFSDFQCENTGTSSAVFIHHLLALDCWHFVQEPKPTHHFP